MVGKLYIYHAYTLEQSANVSEESEYHFQRWEEGHFVPKSLSNSCPNYIVGPIQNVIIQTLLPGYYF